MGTEGSQHDGTNCVSWASFGRVSRGAEEQDGKKTERQRERERERGRERETER
jgi:hypothetical protein